MITAIDLLKKKSQHQDIALTDRQIQEHLAVLSGWGLQNDMITKTFSFKNYYETMAFVNAVAFVAHAEDHHPELVVTYNRCTIKFNTHSVNDGQGGLSENDFICAAKIDVIYSQSYV